MINPLSQVGQLRHRELNILHKVTQLVHALNYCIILVARTEEAEFQGDIFGEGGSEESAIVRL